MLCYKDRSYCEDACLCAIKEEDCCHKLTESEHKRAATLGLPIAWASFKDICTDFKEVKCLPIK